ncbi:CRISPR-associated endoribonuclease Cas2 [Bernardetia litoralis DSM 6794]|uniref:CRISPR-associated endoribonuclease Cas2 n=1 Tax=Bernardetia litoralis (strain ATCC 23117 / DSM 6794 / NBRC 15988 / NCIMB 1366 / Fx l1 / Sio-4) TaxID=880071 RepID=I4AEY8_BERLS|nr:CRISPR-associated endonuclease Cas2 [Bernardetia litoralis]AFM02523.1 CRISPR-associated endoribonuclease Cas2 [Bernardetia litoralis DSM 6794]
MTYLILYDISEDRIRTHISKHLEERGCRRVQKSVFMAKMSIEKYHEIRDYLQQIQDEYENDDTILFIPISQQVLRETYMIGNNIPFLDAVDDKKVLIF